MTEIGTEALSGSPKGLSWEYQVGELGQEAGANERLWHGPPNTLRHHSGQAHRQGACLGPVP